MKQVILHISKFAFMWCICDRGFSRCVPSTWYHLEFLFLLSMFKYFQSISKIIAVTVNQYNRTIHRVAPDGNCLFRALAHQAFGDQIYHAQMRKALVTLISDNLEIYKPLYMGRRNGFEEHVDRMSKDGIWGTQLEIQAASDCLGVSVYELMYCSATSSHKWITFKPCHVLITPCRDTTATFSIYSTSH